MNEATPRPNLGLLWLDTSSSFRDLAYAPVKRTITAMDIYDHPQEIGLNERRSSG